MEVGRYYDADRRDDRDIGGMVVDLTAEGASLLRVADSCAPPGSAQDILEQGAEEIRLMLALVHNGYVEPDDFYRSLGPVFGFDPRKRVNPSAQSQREGAVR